jgi:membrane associated rhomboid family serine protease
MIPLCDSIPSRTRPIVVFGIGALHILAFAIPADWSESGSIAAFLLAPNAYVLMADLAALWLFGATAEDRLGHLGFATLWVLSGVAAFAAPTLAWPGSALPLASIGAVSGIVAARLALYPRGRLLTATPVFIGFEFADLPSWLYAGAWVLVVVVATPEVPLAPLAAALTAGGITGLAAGPLLKRPERMRVEWWSK